MQPLAATIDIRKHPRAQLEMPVRMRWRGAHGMRFETATTIDLSREGMLLQRVEPCEVGWDVWVAFPFDPAAETIQPETSARIIRVAKMRNGHCQVALRFAVPPATASITQERRAFPRVSFALPVSLRMFGSPWPEESMTQDVSRGGVRVTTSRTFAAGDEIFARIPWGDWSNLGEIPGRVVRVEAQGVLFGLFPAMAHPSLSNGAITSIAIEWKPAPSR